MKRLLATVTLIFCLSFPVFAGHTLTDGKYCEDGTPGCVPDGQTTNSNQQDAPSDLGSEALLILAALAVLYRFKA